MTILFIRLSFILGLLSCGPDTNLISMGSVALHEDTFHHQLAMTKGAYNRGNYQEAIQHGEKAITLDPISDEAAVTLGYAYLAAAGFTPIQIAKEMSAPSEETSEEESDDSSSKTLSQYSTLVKMQPADWKMLGTTDTTEPDLPVILPVCADTARSLIATLYALDQTIAITCRFVDPSLRIRGDYRHSCDPITTSTPNKVHFLWAISHLMEAIIFHEVITYNTTGSSKTNLEQRMGRIQETDVTSPSEIQAFIKKVASLNKTIQAVLPLGGSCSGAKSQAQFTALLNDLLTVSSSFKAIPGIPPELSESITKSVEKIETIQSNNKDVDQQQAQSDNLKGDITKGISESLSKKLDTLEPSDYSEEEKQNLCGSYGEISGSNEDKPSFCN